MEDFWRFISNKCLDVIRTDELAQEAGIRSAATRLSRNSPAKTHTNGFIYSNTVTRMNISVIFQAIIFRKRLSIIKIPNLPSRLQEVIPIHSFPFVVDQADPNHFAFYGDQLRKFG